MLTQINLLEYIEQKNKHIKEIYGLRYSKEPVEGWVQVKEIVIGMEYEKTEVPDSENVYVNPDDLTFVHTNERDKGKILGISWAWRDTMFGTFRENPHALLVVFKNYEDYHWVREIVYGRKMANA